MMEDILPVLMQLIDFRHIVSSNEFEWKNWRWMSVVVNDRLIGTARSQGRPKSTSSTIPRTVLDIRAVQPPIPPPVNAPTMLLD